MSTNLKESQNVEWKEFRKDDYLKWICGFVNAQGGRIVIGVNGEGVPDGVAPEQLPAEVFSCPANPKIANAFYCAGFIESWCRGIREIRETCRDYGCLIPEFRVDATTGFVSFFPKTMEEGTSRVENRGQNVEGDKCVVENEIRCLIVEHKQKGNLRVESNLERTAFRIVVDTVSVITEGFE